MSDLKLTVCEIKDLMEKMADTGLTAVRLRDGDFELSLEAEKKEILVQGEALPPVAVTPAPVSPAPKKDECTGNVVKSPIVGTFYASSAPDKPAFVSEGQTVQQGDVLFIIESMKLMNEIQSEFDGKVKKILVQDGQPVEYGQPILIIE